MKSFTIPCVGYDVAADWYETDDTDHIILFLIGWTSSKASNAKFIESIQEQTGYSVLVFDYSGHGDSTVDPLETRPAQHFLEVICVYDWLKDKYPNAHISVIGSSYGGYMATQLTKYRAFDNLVLRVPAIYKPSDFYTLSKYIHGHGETNDLRKDPEALARHPLLTRAADFKGRTLVLVHENDEQIPKQTTDAYIKAFNAESYVAKGFGHAYNEQTATPEQEKEYMDTVACFLKPLA